MALDVYPTITRRERLIGNEQDNMEILCKPCWDFWERVVRTVKDYFRKAAGCTCLNRDELEAAMVEIEHVINSRPLFAGGPAD